MTMVHWHDSHPELALPLIVTNLDNYMPKHSIYLQMLYPDPDEYFDEEAVRNPLIECPICYETAPQDTMSLLICGHRFCIDCIKRHLGLGNFHTPLCCPMCRSGISNIRIHTNYVFDQLEPYCKEPPPIIIEFPPLSNLLNSESDDILNLVENYKP